jgi:hypothetical protein
MRRKKRKTRRRRKTHRRRTRRRRTRRRRIRRRRTRRKRGSGKITCPSCQRQFDVNTNKNAYFWNCPHCKKRVTYRDINKQMREDGFMPVDARATAAAAAGAADAPPRTHKEAWADRKAAVGTAAFRGLASAHKFLWGKKRAPSFTNEEHRTRKAKGTRKRDKVKKGVQKIFNKTKKEIDYSQHTGGIPAPNELTLLTHTKSGRNLGTYIRGEDIAAQGRYHQKHAAAPERKPERKPKRKQAWRWPWSRRGRRHDNDNGNWVVVENLPAPVREDNDNGNWVRVENLHARPSQSVPGSASEEFPEDWENAGRQIDDGTRFI